MVHCPYCNFIAHPVSTDDNVHIRYCCDRCRRLFVYDRKSGRVVG